MKWVFFYHFNKPASQKAGRNRLSVHFRGECLIVNGVDVRVPCRSKDNRHQPRCVMRGRCRSVTVQDGVAVIE